MSKFIRNESHPYTVITPDTSLADLAEFLSNNIFALGGPSPILSAASSTDDSLVTDSSRKFVLAVATSQDLEVCYAIFMGVPPHLFLTELRFPPGFIILRVTSSPSYHILYFNP